MKRIAVFGGASPRPGDPAYQEAYELGRLVGQAGHTVLTGGYSGTMEAVSRGASEAGGRVIGVTCADLEVWRPLPPNQWIDEEIRFQTLRQRMYGLIDNCDLAFALPGGIGTLAEIAAMWSGMQTGEIIRPPVILIGPGWLGVFQALRASLGEYIREPHWAHLEFAPDVEQAFARAASLIGD